MTWANLSDDLLGRMQHHGLSRDDQLLYVEGLVHASRLLTDGELPSDLRLFTTHPKAAEGAMHLVAFDYWRIGAHGYVITDYLDTNRSAEQVMRDRERNRTRQRRARLHREGDHSMCVPSYCRHAVTNGVSNPVSHSAHSTPLHSTPSGVEVEVQTGKGDTGDGPDGPAPATPKEIRHDYLDHEGSCSICHLPRENARHREAS